MRPGSVRPELRKIKLSERVCSILYKVLKLLAVIEDYTKATMHLIGILQLSCWWINLRGWWAQESIINIFPHWKEAVIFSTINWSYKKSSGFIQHAEERKWKWMAVLIFILLCIWNYSRRLHVLYLMMLLRSNLHAHPEFSFKIEFSIHSDRKFQICYSPPKLFNAKMGEMHFFIAFCLMFSFSFFETNRPSFRAPFRES